MVVWIQDSQTTCPVELDCLNYSYFKNRESAAAEKSCQTVGQKYIWNQLYVGKYKKFQ